MLTSQDDNIPPSTTTEKQPPPSKTFSKEAAEARKDHAFQSNKTFFGKLRESANIGTFAAKDTKTTGSPSPFQSAAESIRDFSANAAAQGKKGPPAQPRKVRTKVIPMTSYTAVFVESAARIDDGTYILTQSQSVNGFFPEIFTYT
jgi:hypothetical protein